MLFTEQSLSKYILKERMSLMIVLLLKVIYLLASNRGAGVLRRVMVKNKGHGQSHQQRFKWLVSILLNLIWDQLGFTKSHEDLKLIDKILSTYQNYKIINFYDGIISSEYAIHNFKECYCLTT